MARKPFTTYWSSLTLYENCPRQFLWSRGWGDIDLGRGPGRGKAVSKQKSEHHILMGEAIQKVIEAMYNDEIWRDPSLYKRLEALEERVFREMLTKRFIDWRDVTITELREVVHNGIFGFVKTFKHNKLIGPYARCETDYIGYIDKWNPIGGRFDFLIRRDDVGTMILDGKNGKRDKNGVIHIDPDQLRFYALAFWLQHKVLPNKLGFIPYRYPWGWVPPEDEWPVDATGVPIKPEPETGVMWVDFDMGMLKALAFRAVEARKGMEKGKFDPTPTPTKCKFCDFEDVCPERQAQKAANAAKRGDKPSILEDGSAGIVPLGLASASGIMTFGFPSKESKTG